MKDKTARDIGIIGNGLSIVGIAYLASIPLCMKWRLSNPLEGNPLITGLYLLSPLIAVFLIVALKATRRSRITRRSRFKGRLRIAGRIINAVGLVVYVFWGITMLLMASSGRIAK
jgi:hypothetical protein